MSDNHESSVRGYPTPSTYTTIKVDCLRIAEAINLIDSDISLLEVEIRDNFNKVDNTRDIDKPVSSAAAIAIALPGELFSVDYDDQGNTVRIEEIVSGLVRVTEPDFSADGRVLSVKITIGSLIRIDTYQYDSAGNVIGSASITETSPHG